MNYEKSDPGTGFTSTSLAPAGFGAGRPGSPPAAGLRGPVQHAPGLPPTPGHDANRGGAGGGGAEAGSAGEVLASPWGRRGRWSPDCFPAPAVPAGGWRPGVSGLSVESDISSGTCASAPWGIVSEVNVRAACTWIRHLVGHP